MLTPQCITQETVTTSPSDAYYSYDHHSWTEWHEIEPVPDTPKQVLDTPTQVPYTPIQAPDTPVPVEVPYMPMEVPYTPMQAPQPVTQEPEGDGYYYHHAQMDPLTPKFGNAAPPPPPCYPAYEFAYYPPHSSSIQHYVYGLPIARPYTTAQAPEETLPMKRNEGVSPLENDVLCGKGLTTNTHIGTVQFRALLAETKYEYLAAKPGEKKVIARKIVNIIHSRGGRFLQKDAFGSWQPVDDEKAIIKKVVYLFTGIRNGLFYCW